MHINEDRLRAYALRLTPLYDSAEAKAIVRALLEELFSMNYATQLTGGIDRLSVKDIDRLEGYIFRLSKGEPLQYVLGYTYFDGDKYEVDNSVLIPRPETEELCRWIINEYKESIKKIERILDCCTGSGCIALTLKKHIPISQVEAFDISDKALSIARKNADSLDREIVIYKDDALYTKNIKGEKYDVIVSNPPYICIKERTSMHSNVVDFEPNNALFVPDEKPLLFYKAITLMGKERLNSSGSLYFEINPLYVNPLIEMLKTEGFVNIVTKNDFNDLCRYVKAEKQ